jgi:hypothetical protein
MSTVTATFRLFRLLVSVTMLRVCVCVSVGNPVLCVSSVPSVGVFDDAACVFVCRWAAK